VTHIGQETAQPRVDWCLLYQPLMLGSCGALADR